MSNYKKSQLNVQIVEELEVLQQENVVKCVMGQEKQKQKKLLKKEKNMKLIDADKLLKDIEKMDLSYMQQGDIIICLEDIINKQNIISKTVEIKNVNVFNNKK